MAYVNLLPDFPNSAWSKTNAENITYPSAYSCSWTADGENDYVYIRLQDGSLNGKDVRLGWTSFSSGDGLGWIHVRLYSNTTEYTSVSVKQPDTATEMNFSVPQSCTEIRIYVRHEFDSDGFEPTTISIQGLYLYDLTVVSTLKLNFHKVLKQNLPELVEPGSEHVYYTFDGTDVEMYISTMTGQMVPIKASSSGAAIENTYNNLYTQAAIDERKALIKQLQNSDNITFTIATDIHARHDEEVELVNRYNQVRDFIMLTKQIPIDYVICCGDLLQDGEVSTDLTEHRMVRIGDIFKQCHAPVFLTRGNHDTNTSYYNTTLDITQDLIVSNKEYYNMLQKHMLSSDDIKVINNSNHPLRNYYYVDDHVNKHRMIFVNTFEIRVDDQELPYVDVNGDVDYALVGLQTKEQIEWLLNDAMNMTNKTDWVVSFFSHMIPYTNIPEFHGYGKDDTTFRQILNAFRTGGTLNNVIYQDVLDMTNSNWIDLTINKSFTTQGAIDVIGYFGGHIHDDCYAKHDGINYFVSTNTCVERRTTWSGDPTPTKLPPERNGESLATSINVFIINKKTKTVNVVKVGSKRNNAVVTSSDYTFTY